MAASTVGRRSKSADPADCSLDEVVEFCDRCGDDTVHAVVIAVAEMTTDGNDGAKYSREPQRVSQCADCGDTTTEWLTRT